MNAICRSKAWVSFFFSKGQFHLRWFNKLALYMWQELDVCEDFFKIKRYVFWFQILMFQNVMKNLKDLCPLALCFENQPLQKTMKSRRSLSEDASFRKSSGEVHSQKHTLGGTQKRALPFPWELSIYAGDCLPNECSSVLHQWSSGCDTRIIDSLNLKRYLWVSICPSRWYLEISC